MDYPIPVKIFIPRIDELTEPTSNIQYEVIIQEERETETGEISNRITENELNIFKSSERNNKCFRCTNCTKNCQAWSAAKHT